MLGDLGEQIKVDLGRVDGLLKQRLPDVLEEWLKVLFLFDPFVRLSLLLLFSSFTNLFENRRADRRDHRGQTVDQLLIGSLSFSFDRFSSSRG